MKWKEFQCNFILLKPHLLYNEVNGEKSPLVTKCHKTLVWTLSTGKQKLGGFFPVHLLIGNKLCGNLKEERALECGQSCPMLTCWSRQSCWCRMPSNHHSSTFSHTSQGSHGISECFLQIKNLPEIPSERHGRHTISFPWDVKDSCITASRHELKKSQMNLRDTLEDEIY